MTAGPGTTTSASAAAEKARNVPRVGIRRTLDVDHRAQAGNTHQVLGPHDAANRVDRGATGLDDLAAQRSDDDRCRERGAAPRGPTFELVEVDGVDPWE